MRSSRADVVAAARRWIDTPVFARGRERGIACDCVGLILMVGIETEFLAAALISAPEFVEYGLLPRPASMRRTLEVHMLPIEEPLDGDVGFFHQDKGYPMHLAMRATFQGRVSVIHADGGAKVPRVVEVGYAPPWPDQIDSWWRYPGLA